MCLQKLNGFAYTISEVCFLDEFDCGDGFCARNDSRCNGFADCLINMADEMDCGMFRDSLAYRN